MKELRVAVACSSNMNRSMEAHAFLKKKGFYVRSYGTGEHVRLPGLDSENPNVYDFGTPYLDIYHDLAQKNREYYTQNGLLNMLQRNRRIKPFPERFQDTDEIFDVIITCEERVFDLVVAWFNNRDVETYKPVFVVNIDIEDSVEEAIIGSFLICDVVTKMMHSNNLHKDINDLLRGFEEKSHKLMLNCMMTY